jgi:hypothetical protein
MELAVPVVTATALSSREERSPCGAADARTMPVRVYDARMPRTHIDDPLPLLNQPDSIAITRFADRDALNSTIRSP